MSKVRFVAYGTLRKGSYNYDRFKKVFGDDFNHIETTKVQGLKLVTDNRLPYPYASLSSNHEAVVDIIECSKECFDLIEDMEEAASYETTEIKIGGTRYPIFVHQYTNNLILNDWIEHEKSKK